MEVLKIYVEIEIQELITEREIILIEIKSMENVNQLRMISHEAIAYGEEQLKPLIDRLTGIQDRFGKMQSYHICES